MRNEIPSQYSHELRDDTQDEREREHRRETLGTFVTFEVMRGEVHHRHPNAEPGEVRVHRFGRVPTDEWEIRTNRLTLGTGKTLNEAWQDAYARLSYPENQQGID